jgi:hypothetical protein
MYSAVQRELAGTIGGSPRVRKASLEPTRAEESDPAPAEGEGDGGACDASPATVARPQLRDDSRIKSPVMAFTVGYLREHPDAPFKDVRAAAEAEGHKLYPITYGRAQALLGIVKARPRRTAGKRRAAGQEPPERRRSLVQGTVVPSGDVEGFIDQAQAIQAERDRYRRALETLRTVLIRAIQKAE